MGGLEDALVSLVDTPWVLLIVYGATLIDGFFPPLPSETIVIAATATLAATGRWPMLAAVYVAAVAGAICGDCVAYVAGRHLPVARIPGLRSGRGRAAYERASEELSTQRWPIILSARFIPGVRVGVSVSAGSSGLAFRTFLPVDAAAVALWVVYTMVIGTAAGAWSSAHPLLGVAAGVVAGLVLGLVIGHILSRHHASAQRRPGR